MKPVISYMMALFTIFLIPSAIFGQDQDQDLEKPNIIIIFTEDMGYGDVGVYGHPTIRTPNLDHMAEEVMKFTQIYTAASVCTLTAGRDC